jgi:hypothetical protein
LTGGGDLSSNRTISPVYGTTTNTVCVGNDSRLSDDRTASGLRTATTVVAINGSTAPVAGQHLVATSTTNATWKTVVPLSSTTIVEESTGTSTGSTTFGLLSGMTITPAAGTYTVVFSGDILVSEGNGNCAISIYSGGSVVTASQRTFSTTASGVTNSTMSCSFSAIAKVTVNGSQAIEGRWKTTSGSINNTYRQLLITLVA